MLRAAEQAGPAITARLLDHPGHAPELLALAAVRTLGPTARAWAGQLRASYPAATPDGLARLATQRFVRIAAAGGAATAASGLVAPLAGLATLAWVRAGLVLRLAAAYGQDPTDPERAVDLLVLTGVHPDDETARRALAAAREAPRDVDRPWQRLTEADWHRSAPLATRTAGWLSLRVASRLLPGAAFLAAGASGSTGAQRLAARAVARYRRVTAS